MMSKDRMAEIADRIEIQELLSRYAQIVDARKWDQLDLVFEQGAIIDFTRNGGECLTYPEIVNYLQSSLSIFVGIQHFMTNFVIDIVGDKATARNYVFTQMVSLVDGGEQLLADGGWYDSEFRRGPNGWRMSRYVAGLVWLDGSWPEGVPRPAWWGREGDRFDAEVRPA